jgi:hypothetical protein
MADTNGAMVKAESDKLAPPDAQGPSMGLDPQNMKQLWWLMERLNQTGFLPDAIKTPGQAMAVVLAGRELGLGIMSSLRGIGIIKGKVSISAATQLGLMLKAGIKIKWVEQSTTRACIELSRQGMEPAQFSFTMEEAKQAQLVQGGGNWAKYPAAMLRARAITIGARAYAADIIDGCYDPEEIAPTQVQGSRMEAQPPSVPHDPRTGEVLEPQPAVAPKRTRSDAVKEKLAPPPPEPVDDLTELTSALQAIAAQDSRANLKEYTERGLPPHLQDNEEIKAAIEERKKALTR